MSLSPALSSKNGVLGRGRGDARGGEGGFKHGMSENSQHREQREFMMDAMGDLEGGPGGAAVQGRTPVLVVGNKEDLGGGGGGGVRCTGAALAEELGAAHVTVVSGVQA